MFLCKILYKYNRYSLVREHLLRIHTLSKSPLVLFIIGYDQTKNNALHMSKRPLSLHPKLFVKMTERIVHAFFQLLQNTLIVSCWPIKSIIIVLIFGFLLFDDGFLCIADVTVPTLWRHSLCQLQHVLSYPLNWRIREPIRKQKVQGNKMQ